MRAGRSLLASLPFLVASLLALQFASGSSHMDPGHTSDEYMDAVNGAACYAHHGGEGFRPFDFGFAETYTVLPIGEVVQIPVLVAFPEDSMPTPQEHVDDIRVTINLTQAPNVRVVPDEIGTNVSATFTEDALGHAEVFEDSFLVGPHAVSGHVGVRVTPRPDVPGPVAGEWTASVMDHPIPARDRYGSLDLEDLLAELRPGPWSFRVEWRGDSPLPLPGDMHGIDVEVSVFVNHSADGPLVAFHSTAVLRSRADPITLHVPVLLESRDAALLDFRVRGTAFWNHLPGDGANLDEGVFLRFLTMEVRGEEPEPSVLIPGPAGAVLVAAALVAVAAALPMRRRGRETD